MAQQEKALIQRPYVLPSQMATTGNGTLVNGGALFAGDNRPFPQESFNFSLDRPLFIVKIGFKVTRLAGGDDIDSDYDNVLAQVRDTNTDQDLQKNPVPLSVLCTREDRQYIFYPGKIPLQSRGSGLVITMSVNPGAVGAPFNMSCALIGYTEERGVLGDNYKPAER